MVTTLADQFESFNRLAESLQQYSLITSPELDSSFREIDMLLRYGIRTLLAATHFVEDTLCHRLAEIAIGSIKTKVYRGKFDKSSRGVGRGVMLGAENAKILGVGFDLFKLSRASRALAPPYVLRVMRSLRLQNIIYEQTLRAFADVTSQYRHTCENLASAQQRLKQAEEDGADDLIQQMQYISDLIDTKEKIESRAGCVDPNILYGSVAQATRYTRQITLIQEKIVKAYLRSIPRIVREFAQSDLDALDMFQAGSFGLMHAISAYDFRSRAGFARFSRTWIRQRIRGYLKESGGPLIQLSPNVWESSQEIRRARRRLKEAAGGGEPTREEIANKLGWTVQKVEWVLEKVALCRVSSLDDTVCVDDNDDEAAEQESYVVADVLAADNELLIQHQEQVETIIENLSPADRRLICLRFGCVEFIENADLDGAEVINELFRQLACKTLVHQYAAGRIDKVQSVPLEETDTRNNCWNQKPKENKANE